MNDKHIIPLSRLHTGECAAISYYDNEHAENTHKLMMLGLTPGTDIEIIGVSPFSDPIVVHFRGFKLSIRKSELTGIWVEKNAE